MVSDQFELVSTWAVWLPLISHKDRATRQEQRRGSVAQFEREMMLERQREGIQKAEHRGGRGISDQVLSFSA